MTSPTLDDILTTSFHKEEMIAFIQSNSDNYLNAIQLIISDEEPQAWRCAWLVGHCMVVNDKNIIPLIDTIIHSIQSKEDGHQRELIKILMKMKLSDEQEGRLFDSSMTIWETISKSSSVRITAFKFLIATVKKHPELKSEIDFLTQVHYTESLSKGIKNSFQKLINSI